MSYDDLRNTTRRILEEIEETKGYKGRIVIDEHPWGAEDMLAVSAVPDGKVTGALFLRAVLLPDGEAAGLDIDALDMTTLTRRTVASFGVSTQGGVHGRLPVGEVSHRLYELLGEHLGPTAAEQAREREAADLVARTRATRPRVVPEVSPAEAGGFDLVLHGLTANDVLRAVEALPEAKPAPSSRTAYDHLLADEL